MSRFGLGQVGWRLGPDTLICDGAAGQALWDETLERGALNVSGQLLGLAWPGSQRKRLHSPKQRTR